MNTSGSFSDSEDFKPSDLQDPNKVQFLSHLAQRIWKFHKKSSLNDNELSSKLLKILSPPDDYNESVAIKPKKKNIFSSSSFYSSALHPTVEDQVNLARQISHSLSDAGNRQSRGQSMYVNRKKRSTKWVHDGLQRSASETFETNYDKRPGDYNDEQDRDEYNRAKEKSFFELIMDPRGHVKDIHSLVEKDDNVEHSPLSPELCLKIVKDLNSPKGKGAELFAKRRKKSEKWVVNETYGTNDSSHSSSTDFVDYEMSDSCSEQKDNLLYEDFPVDQAKYTVQTDPNEPYHPKTYEFLKRIPTASNNSLQNQNYNFNTAARGWNQNLTVYHPVKFDEKKTNRNTDSPATFHHLLYTDY